jgi:hypothetical protein
MTMPVLAVAAIPLMVWAGRLFPWADAGAWGGAVAGSAILKHRDALYRPGMVIARWAVFLVVWSVFAWRFRSLSREHDRTGEVGLLVSARRLGAFWLVVHFVTMSLGAVDWIASREVDWYSSTFGLVVVVGQCTAALATVIAAAAWRDGNVIERSVDPGRAVHDWGNLLQTVVVLWSYISFAQFLVIWIGNTQEDIVWFHHRNIGGWKAVSAALIVLHFAAPFVVLLFQGTKRNARRLGWIALGVLVMRVVDNVWMVVPSPPPAAPTAAAEVGALSWADVVLPVVMLVGWAVVFEWLAGRRLAVPRAWTEIERGVSPAEEVGHGHA